MRQETAIWAESYFSAEDRTQIHTHTDTHNYQSGHALETPDTPLVPAQSTVQQQTPTQPSFILSVSVCVCVCIKLITTMNHPTHRPNPDILALSRDMGGG